jgi:hypothetical protein
MDSVATSAPSRSEPRRCSSFPGWLLSIGLVALFESGVFAACLIWEQTVLTWERGPQNVGFTLIHGAGAFLVLFPPVLAVWLAVSIAYTLRRLLRRRPLSRVSMAVMVLSIWLLWVLWLPYGFWQKSFVDRLMRGSHVGELFVYNAAAGDLAMVKAFLAHGTPVDIRPHGQTALHAAAAEGQTEVIKYLVAEGADVSATDHFNISPLDAAVSGNHKQSTTYLLVQGARSARGEEKRTKAGEVVP